MKERRDLVQGWLRKANSDLAVVELALNAGVALDTACFHAQQAAERALAITRFVTQRLPPELTERDDT